MTLEAYLQQQTEAALAGESGERFKNILQLVAFPWYALKAAAEAMMDPDVALWMKIVFPLLFLGYISGRADKPIFFHFSGPYRILGATLDVYIVCLLLFAYMKIGNMFSPEARKARGAIRTYRLKQESGFRFTSEQYQAAAQALRDFKPMTYSQAVGRFSQESVDILVMTKMVAMIRGKWQRIVSIKAIEQDREADARDDDEA